MLCLSFIRTEEVVYSRLLCCLCFFLYFFYIIIGFFLKFHLQVSMDHGCQSTTASPTTTSTSRDQVCLSSLLLFFFSFSLFSSLPILVLFRHKFLYDLIFISADNYYTGGACDIGRNANTAAFWGQLAFDYNNYYAPADNGYFLYVH